MERVAAKGPSQLSQVLTQWKRRGFLLGLSPAPSVLPGRAGQSDHLSDPRAATRPAALDARDKNGEGSSPRAACLRPWPCESPAETTHIKQTLVVWSQDLSDWGRGVVA